MMHKQRVLRFSLAHFRKETCSEESCHYFGTKLHAKQAATLHAKHGVLQYYQIYNTELTRGAVEDFRNALGADWEIQRHDLTVELYVRDLGTLRSIASDPEFATFHHLEEPYLSRNHVVVSLGWVEAYIEDGKVVNVLDDGTPVYGPAYADYVRDGGSYETHSLNQI